MNLLDISSINDIEIYKKIVFSKKILILTESCYNGWRVR